MNDTYGLERKHNAFMRYDGNDVVSLIIHAGELQTELLAEVKRLREVIDKEHPTFDWASRQTIANLEEEVKRLQEEVEHHKNMYCVDCGACGDMDSYADKHCICLFKTEGDDE